MKRGEKGNYLQPRSVCSSRGGLAGVGKSFAAVVRRCGFEHLLDQQLISLRFSLYKAGIKIPQIY